MANALTAHLPLPSIGDHVAAGSFWRCRFANNMPRLAIRGSDDDPFRVTSPNSLDGLRECPVIKAMAPVHWATRSQDGCT